MRAVEWIRAILAALLFWYGSSLKLDAQQNANLPDLYQSTNSTANPSLSGRGANMPQAVVSGHLVVCSANWDNQNTLNSMSFVDTGSFAPFTMGTAVPGLVINVGGQNQQYAQMGYAFLTGSGNDGFDNSVAFPRLFSTDCVEITQGGNLAFDAQASSGGCANAHSCTVTSTQQNDIIVCVLASPDLADSGVGDQSTNVTQYGAAAGSPGRWPLAMTWFQAGAAGTQTCSFNVTHNADYFVTLAMAFKPVNIKVGTSALPVGGNGTAYSATITSYGGSGAITCSLTAGSLQTGLSLGGTGNCTISGTPTVTSSNAITVQVSDGTHTATQNLTMQVLASLATVQVRTCQTYTTSPSTVSLAGTQVGDVITVHSLENCSHCYLGYMQPPSALTDSCGDTFSRVRALTGGNQGGLVTYVTTASCAGSLTLSENAGLGGGTPVGGVACDISGAQSIVDTATIANSAPASGTSTTLNAGVTTVVPNELVLSFCGIGSNNNSNTASCSIGSPFSTLATASSSFAVASLADEAAPTTGTYTATGTFTDGSLTTETPVITTLAIRPGAASTLTNLGEKIRRYVN